MENENKGMIIVIEDDGGQLEFIRIALTRSGYTVKAFNNPSIAIDWICDNPENIKQPPILTLTDLDLGRGYTGLKMAEIAREAWKSTPVAIMSGGFMVATEEQCRKYTDHILLKPFMLKELVDFIENTIKSSKHASLT
jgi:DNA-binding NtrC family response regulator